MQFRLSLHPLRESRASGRLALRLSASRYTFPFSGLGSVLPGLGFHRIHGIASASLLKRGTHRVPQFRRRGNGLAAEVITFDEGVGRGSRCERIRLPVGQRVGCRHTCSAGEENRIHRGNVIICYRAGSLSSASACPHADRTMSSPQRGPGTRGRFIAVLAVCA